MKIELTYPEPQYRDRLTTLAYGTVHRGASAEDIKADIEYRRKTEGNIIAEDFAKLCRELWRRQGR